jgi:DNA-3-methyladenine glycosylase I
MIRRDVISINGKALMTVTVSGERRITPQSRVAEQMTDITKAQVPALKRCAWATTELGIRYHDQEWGVPIHDDRSLFEFLVLEGAQAGLSWETILRKREAYRCAFDNFDARLIVGYQKRKITGLMANAGIVRNRLKIAAAIANAKAFVDVQSEFHNFDDYIWQFVNGRPKQNQWRSPRQIPVSTRESDVMSRDLRRRGFRFVGPTICYAFMQAVGMVNDHTVGCFRHSQLRQYTS